jgi:hypothetical protein
MQRTTMYKALIVLLALILTGCGAAATGSAPAVTTAAAGTPTSVPVARTSEPATPSEPATSASTPATTRDGEVVAVWNRSGGFAGRTDKMTVYADGRLVVEPDTGNARTVQGDAAAVQALHELVVGSDWQALSNRYGRQVPDAFAYTITAGGKRVETYDGAQLPDVLSQVMEQLNRLYGATRQTGG